MCEQGHTWYPVEYQLSIENHIHQTYQIGCNSKLFLKDFSLRFEIILLIKLVVERERERERERESNAILRGEVTCVLLL